VRCPTRELFALAPIWSAWLVLALEPARDTLLAWPEPDAQAVEFAREIGAAALLVPYSGREPVVAFVEACKRAGITPVAEMRALEDIGILRKRAQAALEAGFAGLAYDALPSEPLRQFVQDHPGVTHFVYAPEPLVESPPFPACQVWPAAVWPGVKLPDPSVASATQQPWVDANLWLLAWLRAKWPGKPVVLSYEPREPTPSPEAAGQSFYGLQRALAEARFSGANALLRVSVSDRVALLAGDTEARAAWQALVQTARFLSAHQSEFSGPSGMRMLVLAGTAQESSEILNLLYRVNATPAVISASNPQAQQALLSVRFPVVIAANMSLPPALQGALLEFARRGGTALVAPPTSTSRPWWQDHARHPVDQQEHRTTYALGRGKFIAYHEPIVDVYEFALDAVSALNWKERDLRIWNAATVLGVAHPQRNGDLIVTLIDYGTRWRRDHDPDFLVQVYGRYAAGELLVPERAEPIVLRPAVRGNLTEFEIRDLRHVGIVRLHRVTQ